MVKLFAENYVYIILSICMIVLVILWMQSGLDKVLDSRGNLDWLKGHFSKSMLKNIVPLLFILITIFELSAGITALLSVFQMWIYDSVELVYLACCLSLVSLTSLFLGQRLAKDYGGAATLMGYFAFVILILLFLFKVSPQAH